MIVLSTGIIFAEAVLLNVEAYEYSGIQGKPDFEWFF